MWLNTACLSIVENWIENVQSRVRQESSQQRWKLHFNLTFICNKLESFEIQCFLAAAYSTGSGVALGRVLVAQFSASFLFPMLTRQ